MDNWDKVDLVWREFIPAAGIAAMTVSAIIGANHISTKQGRRRSLRHIPSPNGASSTTRRPLSTRSARRRKGRSATKLPSNRLRNTGHQDTDRHGEGRTPLLRCALGTGVRGDIDLIKRAVNDVNFQLLNGGSGECSLTEFWNMIGLPGTHGSGDIGWTTDKKLEVHYTSELTAEDIPCLVITFDTLPRPLYEPLHSRNAY